MGTTNQRDDIASAQAVFIVTGSPGSTGGTSQAAPGADATTAIAVQGVTGGKPVGVSTRTGMSTGTVTVSTSPAYSINDVVGGLITFASTVGTAGSGVLQSMRLNMKSIQTAAFDLYIFNANPTASTFTDNAGANINVADFDKVIGVFSFSTNKSGLGTHTNYNLDGVAKAFSIPSGTTLYGVIITLGTPTFASTSDVSATIVVMQD